MSHIKRSTFDEFAQETVQDWAWEHEAPPSREIPFDGRSTPQGYNGTDAAGMDAEVMDFAEWQECYYVTASGMLEAA